MTKKKANGDLRAALREAAATKPEAPPDPSTFTAILANLRDAETMLAHVKNSRAGVTFIVEADSVGKPFRLSVNRHRELITGFLESLVEEYEAEGEDLVG